MKILLGVFAVISLLWPVYWLLLRPAALVHLRVDLRQCRERARLRLTIHPEDSAALKIIENRCRMMERVMDHVSFSQLAFRKKNPANTERVLRERATIESASAATRQLDKDLSHLVCAIIGINSLGVLIPVTALVGLGLPLILILIWAGRVRRWIGDVGTKFTAAVFEPLPA